MIHKTRKEAKLFHEPTYFTGEVCVRGHVVERTTKEGKCVACEEVGQQQYEDDKKARKLEKQKLGTDLPNLTFRSIKKVKGGWQIVTLEIKFGRPARVDYSETMPKDHALAHLRLLVTKDVMGE